jgi:large subunit ribosomal protein L19
MHTLITQFEQQFKKESITDVKSGDTVKVSQKIKEGTKERVQIFEGLVIHTKSMNRHTASITVRKVASGVGVEKTYLLHSPLVVKVEVLRRAKVRRNYLSFMRALKGKSARLATKDFDKVGVNEGRITRVAAPVAAEAPVDAPSVEVDKTQDS